MTDPFQIPDMTQRGLLRFVEIFDNGPGWGEKTIVGLADAKTLERGGAEMLEQALPRLIRIEIPAGTLGDNGVGQLCDISYELFGFGLEQFAALVREESFGRRESD